MTDENKKIPENVDDKLYTVKYKPDTHCHLCPDQSVCAKCTDRVCEFICPAKVYEWDEEQKKLMVGYENCLECGACRIACTNKSLDWKHPKGGKGVTFKCG